MSGAGVGVAALEPHPCFLGLSCFGHTLKLKMDLDFRLPFYYKLLYEMSISISKTNADYTYIHIYI